MTAERFVADPYGAAGQRMYRTGDLVRRTRDGVVDFAGRANDQVKILGFRVEPAEVESVLARAAGVADVAVVARETESGEKRLVAYVVYDAPDPDIGAVREHAAAALPQYMVPAAYVTMDRLPVTPNGKLDRRRLPEPQLDATAAYRAPIGERQELLCQAFADVLDVPRVGGDDSFFDLGGQSLLAMRLTSRLRAVLGVDLTVAELFDAPTVSGLSRQLDERAKASAR